MNPFARSGSHTLRIASLAWPILIGQFSVIANSVVDTMMVSRFSVTDLSALAIGIAIYITVYVTLNGILQSLSPIIGQLYGAQRFEDIGHETKQGVWLAIFLSGIGCLLLLFPEPLLWLAQATPELAAKTKQYLRMLAVALPASMGFIVYSALNNALAKPKMVMAIHVGSLLLKIPLNALFIFGGLGIPALGGPGCGLATAVVAWLGGMAAWLILRHVRFYDFLGLFGTGFIVPQWASLKELLRIGLPIGLGFFIEVTSFTLMAIFIARLGETPVAAHQIVANFSTLLYMIPLSIASATGTLVAQSIGANDLAQAQRISFSGIRLAILVTLTVGMLAWLLRLTIIAAYSPPPAVVAMALPLFLFVALYQAFDATQVVASYILRAYKIVLGPTVMYALALWCIGLGGGIVLGLNPFALNIPRMLAGVNGFWFGNSVSLVILACCMLWYLRRVQRHSKHAG